MEEISKEMVDNIESGDPERMKSAKKLADSFFQMTGKDITYTNGDVRFSVKDMIIPESAK